MISCSNNPLPLFVDRFQWDDAGPELTPPPCFPRDESEIDQMAQELILETIEMLNRSEISAPGVGERSCGLKRKFEDISGVEKKYVVGLEDVVRGYKVRRKTVLPRMIAGILDEKWVDGPVDKAERQAQYIMICRKINERFSDHKNWGKSFHISTLVSSKGNRVLLELQTNPGVCTPTRGSINLWVKFSPDGSAISLHFIPHKKKESIIGKGTYRTVFAARCVDLQMKPLRSSTYCSRIHAVPSNNSVGTKATIRKASRFHKEVWDRLASCKKQGHFMDVHMSPPPELVAYTRSDQQWFPSDFRKALKSGGVPLDIGPNPENYVFDQLHALAVFRDVLKFVDFLGENGRVHGDIKPDNINIAIEKKRFRGLVNDFDMAGSLYSSTSFSDNSYFLWDPCTVGTGIFTPLTDIYAMTLLLCGVVIPHVDWVDTQVVRDHIHNHLKATSQEVYETFVLYPKWEYLFDQGKKRLSGIAYQKVRKIHGGSFVASP
jgi:hypothetical protein